MAKEHSNIQCARELAKHPDFDQIKGTPAIFACPCGRQWGFHKNPAGGVWKDEAREYHEQQLEGRDTV